MTPIDLRSDTVTRPSDAMRQAMAMAPVGDDVFGEDPTVNELQTEVAALLGKEAALYVPTGCMANQLAVNFLAGEGDEAIVEYDSHIFNYETTAASFLSRVQLHPVKAKTHGILTVEEIESVVRSKEYYMPVTRMLAIENTHNRAGGTIYPIERIKEISEFARKNNILLYIDGARLWNACAATGIAPKEYAKYFDTVSVCFSKGLGAPVGSAICSTKANVEKARRARKIWGGGMRQAGIIAAGALYALRNNLAKVGEDNAKAKRFAEIISAKSKKVTVDHETVQTNICLINLTSPPPQLNDHIANLDKQGIRIASWPGNKMRAVMHLDVSMAECEEAATIIANYFG
ncbi:MAG TPA: GntG family PLP-dependent aldolase [Candidatus Kapabacteria bacterium]|nr:GntG family PLP-dependent aldolase [Candidatus Kapabacteria bacterium]